MGISIPKIKYRVIAEAEDEEVFKGMVVPLPTVLIHFLMSNELKIVSAIIEDSIAEGDCALTYKELKLRLNISVPSIASAMKRLRLMGIVSEGHTKTTRVRHIDYKVVQHLNDLVEGEAPGVMERIRNITRKHRIIDIKKADILKAYDERLLPPDHDPEEEEIYD